MKSQVSVWIFFINIYIRYFVASTGHIFGAISTLSVSIDVILKPVVPFEGLNDNLLHLGVQLPKTAKKGRE